MPRVSHHAEALDWLERTADARALDLIGLRPGFAAPRCHRRFTGMLQRLGLS